MANYKLYIPHIKKWEGGLSRSKSDFASKNPCPYPWKDPKSGKTYSDWHTYKGITWSTFSGSLPHLTNVPSNFFQMTDEVWEHVFKDSYWDAVDADKIVSQACANCVVQWAWGSGVSGSLKLFNRYLTDVRKVKMVTRWPLAVEQLNAFIVISGEKVVFEELCAIREVRLREAAVKNPANLKGWLNRLADFKAFNAQFFAPPAV